MTATMATMTTMTITSSTGPMFASYWHVGGVSHRLAAAPALCVEVSEQARGCVSLIFP